jgi:hypothetical protein
MLSTSRHRRNRTRRREKYEKGVLVTPESSSRDGRTERPGRSRSRGTVTAVVVGAIESRSTQTRDRHGDGGEPEHARKPMDMVRAANTCIADDGAPSGEDVHLQALVAAVGRRNPAALRELYTLTSPRLLLAFGTAGDPALLEDVLVATYARVWRTEAAREPCRAGVMPWLTRVAAAELITQGRQRPQRA